MLTRCGLLAVRLDQGGTSRWAFHPPPWTSEPAWTAEGTLLTEGTVLGQEVLCVGGRGVQRRQEVGVFSAESGRLLHTLPGHAAQVCEDFAVALPRGRTVGHLGIGGALTREVWTQRERFDGDAAQLACGPRSGVKCFSGMLGVHGFSYEDGRPTWHLPRGPGARSVTWSPDERVFVVWSLTGVLTVAEDGRVASEWDWPAAAGGPASSWTTTSCCPPGAPWFAGRPGASWDACRSTGDRHAVATSEPPIVPDASPELNVALAAVWELCELHLRKSGEFLPFGGILRNDGAFDVLFGDTDVTVDGLVSGAASRELVIEGLKRRAPYLPGEVVVIARNVRTNSRAVRKSMRCCSISRSRPRPRISSSSTRADRAR